MCSELCKTLVFEIWLNYNNYQKGRHFSVIINLIFNITFKT